MSSVDIDETPESCSLQHKPIENAVLKAALGAWVCAASTLAFKIVKEHLARGFST